MDKLPPYDPTSSPRLSMPCPNYLAQNRYCGLKEMCIFSHRPGDYISWNLVPYMDGSSAANPAPPVLSVAPPAAIINPAALIARGEKRPASVTSIDQPVVKKSTAELIREYKQRQDTTKGTDTTSMVKAPPKSALKKAPPAPAAKPAKPPPTGKVLIKIPPEITPLLTGNDKVPLNVRQTVLDKLYQEYLVKHSDDKRQAAIDALRTESEIYEKSTSKIVYQNFGAHALSNLKKANPS